MILASCYQMPVTSVGQVKLMDAGARDVASESVSETKAKASYDPSVLAPQKLTAPSSGTLAGSSITVQSGALALATDLVVEEGSSFSNTSIVQEIGLTDEPAIQQVGAGLIIRPTESASLVSPLTIVMPIPLGAGLNLQSTSSLAVFYKQYVGDALISGVIPTDKIALNRDGTCTFSGYFGVYWVAVLAKPVTEAKSVPTQEPIVNRQNVSVIESKGIVTEAAIVAQAAIPEMSWGPVSIAFDEANRTVNFQAAASGEQKLVQCKAELYTSPTAGTGLHSDTGTLSSASIKITATTAQTLYGRFRCQDSLNRMTFSGWSEAVQVPAVPVQVPPALFVALTSDGAGNDGYVNLLEKDLTTALWTLNASGYTEAEYSDALKDPARTLVCDGTKTYGRKLIPGPNTLETDGEYAVCVRLKNASGTFTYGKSAPIVRDATLPKLTSFTAANAALDGYINENEKLLTSALWVIEASEFGQMAFSQLLSESNGSVSCDASKVYDQAAIPRPSDMTSDSGYALCVRLSDAAGNIRHGKSQVVIRDIMPPTFLSLNGAHEASDGKIGSSEVNATNPLVALSATGASVFAYTAPMSDSGGTLICDASATYALANPPSISSLVIDGSYVVCVRLADAAGNTHYAKSQAIVRDTTPPSGMTLSGINSGSDGIINTNELTSTLAPWSLSAGDWVSAAFTAIQSESGGALGCDGTQTYSLNAIPLVGTMTSDGPYAICAQLTDAFGNISYIKSQTLTRDSITFVSLVGANAAIDGFISSSEAASSDSLLTLSASGYDIALYTLPLTSGASVTCDATQNYNQGSMPPINALGGDGVYAVCVKLSDAAGNIVYGKSALITKDITPPTFTSLTLAGAAIGGFINDNEKNLTSALWSLSASGQDSVHYTIPLEDSSAALVCSNAQTYGQTSIPRPVDLTTDGEFVICVKLSDAVGNTTYSKSAPLKRDIVAPSVSSFVKNGAAADGYINSGEAGLGSAAYSITHSGATSINFTVALDDSSNITCSSGYTYSQPSLPLMSSHGADGPYAVCAQLMDDAGNTFYSKSETLVKDTVVPTFSSLNTIGLAADGYINQGEQSDSSPLWTAIASGHTTLAFTTAIYDSSSSEVCNDADSYSEGTTIPGASALTSDGQWTVCGKAMDAAGNASHFRAAYISRDTLAPNFTSLPLATVASDGFINQNEFVGGAQALAGTLSANGHTSSSYKLTTAGTTCNQSLSYGANPQSNSGDFSADGFYKICVKVSDDALNAAYGESPSFVLDRSPPTFGGIKEIMVSSDLTEATLFWKPATDTHTLPEMIGYDICANPTPGSCTSSFTSNETVPPNTWNKTLTSLSGGDYSFVVRARDMAGNLDANTVERSKATLNGVAQLEAGSDFSCARMSDNTVKCWGNNSAGQLGNNTTVAESRPVEVQGLTNVTSIALSIGGGAHACALINDGSVKCWGRNTNGQLGDNSTTQQLTPVTVTGLSPAAVGIAVGFGHSCAVLNDNTVKCWGLNADGQLGNGTTGQSLIPVDTGLTNATSVAAGRTHTCAILGVSGVSCWGSGTNGELGYGTAADSSSPVAVTSIGTVSSLDLGDRFSCAVLADQTAKCWGYNGKGQLGNGNIVQQEMPVAVRTDFTVATALPNILELKLGMSHACARLSSNQVKCWGSHDYGQGVATSTTHSPEFVPSISSASSLALGDYHSCVYVSGAVKCWGKNSNGGLGTGYALINPSPVILPGLNNISKLSVGSGHVCSVHLDNTAKCWGENGNGQLGRDIKGHPSSSPASVYTSTGNSAPLSGVTKVVNGGMHSCALLSSGGVKCWGYNGNGQLGTGSTTQYSAPFNVSSLSAGVLDIALGASHSCALMNDFTVKCWGMNTSGQLGTGNNTPSNYPVTVTGITNAQSLAVGDLHSCAGLTDGTAVCWGKNINGQLGDSTTTDRNAPTSVSGLTDVSSIDLGSSHSCAVLTSGLVKCWGHNSNGQLGNGNTTQSPIPVNVSGLSTTVTMVSLGMHYSCARMSDSSVQCWGLSFNYQTGQGTTSNIMTPQTVKGLMSAETVQAGDASTCTIQSDGTARCWGASAEGQGGPAKPYLTVPSQAVLAP